VRSVKLKAKLYMISWLDWNFIPHRFLFWNRQCWKWTASWM